MDNNKNIRVITFGCRLNTYESEVMKKYAEAAGLENVIIVNSCAVTGEAERQARQRIRRERRENPDAMIVVTGCGVQTNSETFSEMEEVDKLVGNDLKLKAETWKDIAGKSRIQINDIMTVEETAGHLVSGFDNRTRVFLQVQNGCDHRCTFCIIPFGRGNSRSVPMEEVIDQAKMLASKGYRELVLTGVDITSYGADLEGKPKLGSMVRKLLEEAPGIERLRLSSLDPAEIDDDLWWLIENEPRFMPHLHLSMQAGDDMVLKRMKRRHSRQDLIDLCNKARSLRPDVVFGADIIAGFPTESDEMFQNTYDLIKEQSLVFLHVFPYSARTGTPAAKMPQVKGDVRKERAKRLRDLGSANLEAHMQSLQGKKVSVLVEKNRKGHTEYFSEVLIDKDVEQGKIIEVEITSMEEGFLNAKVLEEK